MEEWNKSRNFFEASKNAYTGLAYVLRNEPNVRRQFVIAGGALLLALALDISLGHFALFVLASAIVVVVEMLNASLEYIEDLIHPEYHTAIKASKDVAAGAVLVSSIAALIVGLIIFLPPLMELVS